MPAFGYRNRRAFARKYIRSAPRDDPHRAELLAPLSGRVIEVGAGHGLNFAHYPAPVTHVLAIEPEPLLREAAIVKVARTPGDIEIVDATAEHLPAASESFDGAVASLVLCTVADPEQAPAELHRVLPPGGLLRYYEHVACDHLLGRSAQRVLDATIWPRVTGGCHLARDTRSAIQAAGFEVEEERSFSYTHGPPAPPLPHILGQARRPRQQHECRA